MTDIYLFADATSSRFTGVGQFASQVHSILGNKIAGLYQARSSFMLRLYDEICTLLVPLRLPLDSVLVFTSERQSVFALLARQRCIVFIHDVRLLERKKSGLSRLCKAVLKKKKNLRIIASSKATYDDLSRWCRPYDMIYNPISTVERFAELESASKCRPSYQEELSISLCSSFERRKNVDFLPHIARQNPGITFFLYSSSYYVSRAERSLIREIESVPNIFIIQDLDDIHLYKALACSHAFLSLSSFEGFGRSIIEAQSLGVPVISLRNNVSDDILGFSVIYMESLTEVAFSQAILALKRSHAIYSVYSRENSRRFSASRFNDHFSELLQTATS